MITDIIREFFHTHRITKILGIFLGFDALFTILHLLVWWRHLDSNPMIALFNLNYEYNAPVFYQGLKLILFGTFFIFSALLYVHKNTQEVKKKNLEFAFKTLFPLIGFGIVYVGIDEMGQFHEYLPQFVSETIPPIYRHIEAVLDTIGYSTHRWMIYFLPVAVAYFIPLAVLFGKFLLKYNKKYVFAFISLAGLLVLPFIFEYLDPQTSTDIYHWLTIITLEEFFELIGTTLVCTLLLYINLSVRRDITQQSKYTHPAQSPK